MTIHTAFTVDSPSDRVEATGRVIANFAWQHMRAARTFRDHVVALELNNADKPLGPFFEDIRSYGSACMMSAAASLEALINELFITPHGPLRKQLTHFEAEFWGRGGLEWKAPLEKYQIALDMLGKARLDELAAPYRDAWALFELRNALVHYKPTWDPDRKRKVELIEVLEGRYALSPFVDGSADFVTERSMSAGAMRWVLSSSLVFMREFHTRAALDDHKMSAFWQLNA